MSMFRSSKCGRCLKCHCIVTSSRSDARFSCSTICYNNPVFNFYSGLKKKPSPFLQHTVARFEKYLGECRQWIEDLEQLLLLDSDRNSSNLGALLQSLPKVMSNVHDIFVYVATKVESIHQYIESMRTAFLADQRRRVDGNDPFLEVNRRETAKQEAAAKRVHPTLHLPLNPLPSTKVAGLFASSSTPGQSTTLQTVAGTSAGSSGGGFSLSNTQSSAPSASMSPSSLFATPSTSAPVASLFGSSGASPQTPLFGPSSASLFSSVSTPSLFNTAASSLVSATSAGGGLFSTPFGSGAATGSGASFGAASVIASKVLNYSTLVTLVSPKDLEIVVPLVSTAS